METLLIALPYNEVIELPMAVTNSWINMCDEFVNIEVLIWAACEDLTTGVYQYGTTPTNFGYSVNYDEIVGVTSSIGTFTVRWPESSGSSASRRVSVDDQDDAESGGGLASFTGNEGNPFSAGPAARFGQLSLDRKAFTAQKRSFLSSSDAGDNGDSEDIHKANAMNYWTNELPIGVLDEDADLRATKKATKKAKKEAKQKRENDKNQKKDRRLEAWDPMYDQLLDVFFDQKNAERDNDFGDVVGELRFALCVLAFTSAIGLVILVGLIVVFVVPKDLFRRGNNNGMKEGVGEISPSQP
jgi:hypothetical protein